VQLFLPASKSVFDTVGSSAARAAALHRALSASQARQATALALDVKRAGAQSVARLLDCAPAACIVGQCAPRRPVHATLLRLPDAALPSCHKQEPSFDPCVSSCHNRLMARYVAYAAAPLPTVSGLISSSV